MNEERHLLEELNKKIIRCKKCTRLSKYIKKVAKEKVKRFQEENIGEGPCQVLGILKQNY